MREALKIGLQNVYSSQDISSNTWRIGGTLNQDPPCLLIHLMQNHEPLDVDWNKQAALFSPFFKEGKIHVHLKDFADVSTAFILEPGAGFGDLSHPTTRLCLQELYKNVHNRYVLDIGCGNGVLSIASAYLGAVHVHGIDIDPEAIIHANINKELNNKNNLTFSDAIEPVLSQDDKWIGLMNMTRLEQKTAWSGLKDYHRQIDTLVTSGILLEQHAKYLEWAAENKWDIISVKEEEGWLGFVMKRKQHL